MNRFDEPGPEPRAVAYRMLGSFAEADEAVREARLRLGRSGSPDLGVGPADPAITAVAEVCLDMLRSREARPEDEPGRPHRPEHVTDAGERALLADPAGAAPLAALDTLTPAERLAYVLHDLFAIPFEEIAPLVERTPAGARQLATRARRRVEGTEEMPEPDLPRQREVVAAFLAAARSGDIGALLPLLDTDVVLRADTQTVRNGSRTAHGAPAVAEHFAGRAGTARMALVDGAAGLVWAPAGTPGSVVAFTVLDGRVTSLDLLTDPARLDRLDVRILPE